ncbi:metal-dependent hydrolase [Patescibacteria group bacterium]
MFFAHLPAGYLLTHWLAKKFNFPKYWWIAVAGSVLPDLDMLYFFFIDNRQTFHHEYWSHRPLVILTLALTTALVFYVFKQKNLLIISMIFFANIFLHLALDSIASTILWLYPWSTAGIGLFAVSEKYSFWMFNYIFHWTFFFEIGVMVVTAFLFFKRLRFGVRKPALDYVKYSRYDKNA